MRKTRVATVVAMCAAGLGWGSLGVPGRADAAVTAGRAPTGSRAAPMESSGPLAAPQASSAPVTGRKLPRGHQGSWLYRSHSKDKTDPRSAEAARALHQSVMKGSERSLAINITAGHGGDFSFSVYHADKKTPREDVRITDPWAKSKLKDRTGGQGYVFKNGHYWLENVPMKPGWIGAEGADGSGGIYNADTDELWELWKFAPDPTRPGKKTAVQGGYKSRVSQWDGRWSSGLGASATNISMMLSCLGIDDVERAKTAGTFGKAVYLAVDWQWIGAKYHFPAVRSDGWDGVPHPVLQEGDRFILPGNLDLRAYPGMTPFARMLAHTMMAGHPLVVADRTSGGGAATSVEGATGLTRMFPAMFRDRQAVVKKYAETFGGKDAYHQFDVFPWDKVILVDRALGR